MAQVMEKQQLANGAIAVRLRPDAITDPTDSSHDSWHAMIVTATTTSTDVNTWLTARKSDVEAQYSAMQNALSLISVV